MKRTPHLTGRLFLEDKLVGEIAVRGWENAWGFGEFTPTPAYAEFAPQFERWARLMHSADDADHLPEDVADRLREAENALYAIHAKIEIPQLQQCRQIAILTIDGSMIEWKEQWP